MRRNEEKSARKRPATAAARGAAATKTAKPATKAKVKRARAGSAAEPKQLAAERQVDEQSADARKSAKDLIGGLASSTSRIVQKAASILEEEIAMGIVAAQEMERKYVDVEALRDSDSEEVVQRLRKDAHEAVDMVMDAVALATRSIGSLVDKVVRLEARPGSSAPLGAGVAVPTLAIARAVAPGQTGSVSMSLENDGQEATEEFEFHASDLLDGEGRRIQAADLRFEPSKVSIRPGGKEQVTVYVAVPATATPGIYSGLVQATKLNQLRAVLVVTVE